MPSAGYYIKQALLLHRWSSVVSAPHIAEECRRRAADYVAQAQQQTDLGRTLDESLVTIVPDGAHPSDCAS